MHPLIGLIASVVVSTNGMARIPAGSYRPLYQHAGERPVAVTSFSLDRNAVTRGEYLSFVRANPSWRRGAIRPELAEASYLASWRSDLDPKVSLDAPVTEVSRVAANAYCASKGKRLPTIDEWEFAASASGTRRDASDDRAFRAQLLEYYASRHSNIAASSGVANVYGVRGLHDLVWEWTTEAHMMAGHVHHRNCAAAAIGAADPSNYPAFMRSALRSGLTDRSTLGSLGFRCAV